MQNARKCEILTYMPIQKYTFHGHEQVKYSERVYKKWTLHDNIISPKKLEQSVKSPNCRIWGGLIMTTAFKGNDAVDDGT